MGIWMSRWVYRVDGDLDESIKRSASDRLGDLVPQVRARTSPGVFRELALLGLCLELSFSVLFCRTQANLPTLIKSSICVHRLYLSLSTRQLPIILPAMPHSVPMMSMFRFCWYLLPKV